MTRKSMGRAVRMALLSSVLWICPLMSEAASADPPPCPSPGEEHPASTNACGQPTLKPGDTVRLKTALSEKRLEGRIESIDDKQVAVMDKEGGKLSVPWSSIDRLDVQVGLRREYGKWVLIAGGIGLGLGLLLPPEKEEEKACFRFLGSWSSPCHNESRVTLGRDQQAVIGLGVGILAGLISTAASEPTGPRWERVRLPSQTPAVTSLGFGTTAGGGGVAFRVTFAF